jgi:uncharacterized membrane protein YdjX (TVP38/TMEM64 family)
MLQFIQSGGIWADIIFIFLQAVQVIISPIPGEVLNMLGGYLYGTFAGVVYSTAGTMIGSYVAFMLSRKFGRPFVEKFVDNETMKRFDYVLRHRGAFLAFLLFLIPGFPKDYLCYILGLGHLSIAGFLIIASVGRLLGIVLGTLGGAFIRHEQYHRLFILTGLGLLMVLLVMLFRGRLERLLRMMQIGEYKRKKARKQQLSARSRKVRRGGK